jgi:phosphodiesterase/alkaline phosphatase D-like protein
MNKCHTDCCVENAPPEQVHLSLASTDHSLMAVSWVTLTGDISQVKYGTDKNNLNMFSEGTTLTYTKAGWVGVIHRAIMTDLQPATTYYYQVGADDGGSNWSEIFSFTTFTPNKEINFAVIADMAYDVFSDDTVASMIKLVDQGLIDVVIHSGDISYAGQDII